MGRKYTPSEAHLKAVEQMAHKGVAHSKMAKALGISLATFKRNLNHFELYIKKGRDTVDEEAVQREIASVENALLKRCLGHEYEEITIEQKKVGAGEPQVIYRKTVKKQVQPSDSALFYYLGNRAPDKWASVNQPKEIEKAPDLTREEALAFIDVVTLGK